MKTKLDARQTHPDSPVPARQRQRRLSWKELTVLEPRLLALYKEAKAIRDDRSKSSFCANRVWYLGHLRESVSELVGSDAKHPRLSTSEAYDIAYHKIYNALPYCRNCACIALQDAILTTIAARRETRHA
jgi:hypothetical protein